MDPNFSGPSWVHGPEMARNGPHAVVGGPEMDPKWTLRSISGPLSSIRVHFGSTSGPRALGHFGSKARHCACAPSTPPSHLRIARSGAQRLSATLTPAPSIILGDRDCIPAVIAGLVNGTVPETANMILSVGQVQPARPLHRGHSPFAREPSR